MKEILSDEEYFRSWKPIKEIQKCIIKNIEESGYSYEDIDIIANFNKGYTESILTYENGDLLELIDVYKIAIICNKNISDLVNIDFKKK